MNDDDQIYIAEQLSRGAIKAINQIIAAGLDERGDPDAEEHHLEGHIPSWTCCATRREPNS